TTAMSIDKSTGAVSGVTAGSAVSAPLTFNNITAAADVNVTTLSYLNDGTVNTRAFNAPINITADSMQFLLGLLNAGTGSVTLKPFSIGTNVTLGGSNRPAGLSLTGNGPTTELGNIIAGTLYIGRLDGTGNFKLGGNLNISGTPGTDRGAYDLVLLTNGNF